MGLFLLPPQHLYPNHLHGADEVYVVLAGSGEWSLAGQAFVQKVTSDIIEVPSMTDHALRTATAPLLMLWSWTGDISYDRYQFTGSASG
jgi:mannose-6-phosphate isomerase-like protein (cupin superfamily)